MSELFEIYQSKLKEKFTEVSKNLEVIKIDSNEETINQIENDLKECNRLVSSIC